MISFNDLQVGDYVIAEFEGKMWEGTVTGLNGDEKQVEVDTGVQRFWYELQNLYPIPVNDEQLLKLNFVKETGDDGSVKYKKGAFRILIRSKDQFYPIEIWYREDHRAFQHLLMVHELQNHYLQMTKIHLTTDVMV